VIGRSERFRDLSTASETAVLALLPLTVFAFAMRSSSVHFAVSVGGPLRWILLFLLCAAAVPYGLPHVQRVPAGFLATLGTLVLLAMLSTTWSVATRITFERAVSFAVLMTAVVLVGAGAVAARERIERLFAALVVGVDIVAIASLVVLAVSHHTAVQGAGSLMPARFRGFGQNPNTAAMLFAFNIPLAVWLVVSTRRRWIRVAAGSSCLLLYGEIMASGSRGALLASAAGTVLFLGLTARSALRLVSAEALAVVFFLVTFQIAGHRPSLQPTATALPTVTEPVVTTTTTTTSTKPKPRPAHSGGPSAPTAPPPSITPPASSTVVGVKQKLTKRDVPVPFIPRQDEIGHPALYDYKPILGYGSGRVYAWLWTVREADHRPVLGYGFGTESAVFVDRFYLFEGGYTENSFVGMYLQLGAIGVLILLLPFLFAVRAAYRVVRSRADDDERALVAAAVSVVGAGFVIAFFQSYLYSVGNVGTLTFWIGTVIAVTAGSMSARAA
jgi:hypothetical protein